MDAPRPNCSDRQDRFCRVPRPVLYRAHMWDPRAKWPGQGSQVASQHDADATILWFHLQSGRGAVWTSDGEARLFTRPELPADITDWELPGIAMRRVRLSAFRFAQHQGVVPGATTDVGAGAQPLPQAGAPLPAGGYRIPRPSSGVPWQSPSSDERTWLQAGLRHFPRRPGPGRALAMPSLLLQGPGPRRALMAPPPPTLRLGR